MDLFTLIPLIVALVIFWRLRSVLGTRTGNERPRSTGYARRDQMSKQNGPDQDDMANDNVVTLPRSRDGRSGAPSVDPVVEMVNSVAGDDKALADGLHAIIEKDPEFDPEQFVAGAKIAYEMIVTSFADGDKKALKGLLSRDVYENFATAIDDRNERNERMQTSFVGIESSDIVGAEMDRDDSHVTVRLVSQMIQATLDEKGEVVDGDLSEVAEITDIWTFSRSTRSRDPNWKLIATDG
ncbi:MAG: Tim44/TimA family putative adaptor protein [Pseudomonadota bacterium]